MKRFLLFVIIVILAVYAVSRWNQHRRVLETFTPATTPVLDLKNMQVLSSLNQEYTSLVQAVVPSVVSVTTSRKVEAPQMVDPFEFFFGHRQGRGQAPRQMVQNYLGSGVIVSKEGHILTNDHVVANMDEVAVQLSDGRRFPAKIIGTDAATDIAVLKIDATGLKPLSIGNSDTVKVGSIVFAIGNPFGLQETVTHGIVSATRRRLSDDSENEFFQTDTAINPGNSGGPLVNLQGEIIGINSAIGGAGTGTWEGVGFAIPSNVARNSLENIVKTGHVAHGYLGVQLAEPAGLPARGGALVESIVPESPAAKAGIKTGDIIISFNGKPIQSPGDLVRLVAKVPVNSKAQIKLVRGNQEQTLSVTILEKPAGFALPATPTPTPVPTPALPPSGTLALPSDNPLAGITVVEIPPGQQDSLPPNVTGVMVSQIDPDAPAANSLQLGDVIEEVNRQPATNPLDFKRIASSLTPGKPVLLSISHGKRRSFIVVAPR